MRPVAKYLLTLALLACLAACGGLSGEPQIVSTVAPEYPPQTPDLSAGSAVFAEHCAACHGTGGAGDGDLVQSGQIPAPTDFTDPTAVRDQSPADFYDVITQGRIEKMMPPWQDALSAQQRWDVALYTYSLHYSPDEIARGAQICAGDACADMADIASDPRTVNASDADLHTAMLESVSDDADAWAMVAYLRSQTVQSQAAAAQQQPTPDDSGPESVTGTISGRITNGTAGGTVPDALPVLLFRWDADLKPLDPVQATADAEGRYHFDDQEINRSYTYAVAVDYRDRRFASDIVTGQAVTPLDIPISIYELTEDPSVITIAGLVSQITAVADGAQIVESFNIHNDSDRLYTTSNQLGDKQYASLVFSLPPASTFIGEPNGSQRFRVTEDQTTVVDTVPVPPGVDHIVQFVFLLPYQGDAIIDQPVNYKLNGAVRLLLQPDTLEIISNSLESLGPQTVGQKTYKGYGGTLSLAADDSLTFELRGEAAAEAAELQPPATVSPTTLVLLVIVIVLLLGLLASWFFYRRQHLRPSKTARMDALLRQISELDAAHERGEINHDLYQRQRQDLKAELATYMQEDHEQPAD